MIPLTHMQLQYVNSEHREIGYENGNFIYFLHSSATLGRIDLTLIIHVQAVSIFFQCINHLAIVFFLYFFSSGSFTRVSFFIINDSNKAFNFNWSNCTYCLNTDRRLNPLGNFLHVICKTFIIHNLRTRYLKV